MLKSLRKNSPPFQKKQEPASIKINLLIEVNFCFKIDLSTKRYFRQEEETIFNKQTS